MSKQQSVMTPQKLFSKVSKPDTQRSTFDRSHGYKTTFDAGQLIPFYVDEALPGDTINLSATMFGRTATPIHPIMDNQQLDTHFFSVPIRLVWENFQKFMGEQVNPGDSTDFLMPMMSAPATVGYAEGSMQDYLGIPTKIADLEHRADFMRAIHLIWNEWYRDENLQDSQIVDMGDGPDDPTRYCQILPRGKRKDYFTSALPFAQKGDAVTIPLGTTAPVIGSGDPVWGHTNTDAVERNVIVNPTATLLNGYAAATGQLYISSDSTESGLIADLSNASAQTINQLREAFALQKILERDARGGTRYTEMNYAHFGVVSPDQRLQRPEYLGGGTTNINMTPIQQQSETTANSPQGNLAAMGTFASSGNGFTKSFTEHEIIIGFVSARADLNYQQGLNKMWSRATRFDHYFPAFAHLGEQAVLNREIFATGLAADDDVFGYQERYAEYRYKPSQVTGLFRSNAVTSLDSWHLAQDFATTPQLNDTFIVEQPPIDRTIAVPSEPHYILDCFINLKHTRPMPTYSIPGMIDHF